eukprot:TRINITY_DN3251_c0_g1_i7.p2 TRINITY_DN3251_c0_g1~~TRINITY_DN3251_c0_g1_i7.p2  ORF type:complete len:136 (-),score=21.61 TRINITY_DN3251_c0_g1_i7:85-492(-)
MLLHTDDVVDHALSPLVPDAHCHGSEHSSDGHAHNQRHDSPIRGVVARALGTEGIQACGLHTIEDSIEGTPRGQCPFGAPEAEESTHLWARDSAAAGGFAGGLGVRRQCSESCLLYTSDAADEEDSVDLGGRRIL